MRTNPKSNVGLIALLFATLLTYIGINNYLSNFQVRVCV